MTLLVSLWQSGDHEALRVAIHAIAPTVDSAFRTMLTATLSDRRKAGDVESANMLSFIMSELTISAAGLSGYADQESENLTECSPSESQFIRAGELLRQLLRDAAGDVSVLTELVIDCLRESKIDSAFRTVLQDNINACEAAGYENKMKIFNFIKLVIDKETTNSSNDALLERHHAPQFVDSRNNSTQDSVLIVETPESFIETGTAIHSLLTESVSALKGQGSKNNKKKAIKNASKKKTETLAKTVSDHLEKKRYAVLDHFLPLDLVRRVRVEAMLFHEFYEQSEIWVGKQADVGAQISVPSVRGDKVLWMCGGHTLQQAPEGMSRTVKTLGEIEPCKLDVKAAAPIRKFHGMKEVMNAIDKFVFELKEHCPSLSGVFERTDAMLTIYPGSGSRFANHIDNTTGDGRVLTVVLYLNPVWDPSNGGALRVSVPGEVPSTATLAAKSSSNVASEPSRVAAQTDLSVTIIPEDSSDKDAHLALDVYPNAGRAVLFFSSEIPHEVLPVYAERHAISFWYYDATERRKAVDDAKKGGRAEKVAKSTVEVQQEAKQFIEILLGRDVGAATAEDLPTESDLIDLRSRIKVLSHEATEIVASITGAPSVESFRTGFEILTISDLDSMRKLFRRMGLK